MADGKDKPVAFLSGEIRTPPFSSVARMEAGHLLRQLQQGISLSMPQSRPMARIGSGCHELRIRDADKNWRIIYFVDPENVAVLEIFNKTTRETPDSVIENCKTRLSQFLNT